MILRALPVCFAWILGDTFPGALREGESAISKKYSAVTSREVLNVCPHIRFHESEVGGDVAVGIRGEEGGGGGGGGGINLNEEVV